MSPKLRFLLKAVFFFVFVIALKNNVLAQNLQKKQKKSVVETLATTESNFLSEELNKFEQKVVNAKKMGATHIVITENIPPNLAQFDVPGDPYPAWYIYHPGLLIIFPPKEMQPYMDMVYAETVAALFQERCKILRKYGLRAAYVSKEPHVIPEKFFTDHPALRGPRCDQVNRSCTARFAPCVDRPEVMQLYRESMQLLLKRCPEVEIFSFMTTDAGSGLCWSPGLYPGINGNSECRNNPMSDRVAGFMEALRDGAQDAGKKITVDIYGIRPRQWMLPTFYQPELIAKKLPDNFSIEGFVGPDGQYQPVRWLGSQNWSSPVVGLPNVIGTMRKLMQTLNQGESSSLVVSINVKNSFGDLVDTDFDLRIRIFEAYQKSKPRTELELMQTLHSLASEMAGRENADDLLSLWLSLDQAGNDLEALDFGSIFTMGIILTRWINRPLVPFPEDLEEKEKEYYRPFLLQAKDEVQANNLIDIQAMRMFEGYGAHLLVQRIIEMVSANLDKAAKATSKLKESKDTAQNAQWVLLGKRIAVVESLVRTIDNVVAYQALLDRIKTMKIMPEPNPVLGTRNSWDREEIMRIARNEADNAVKLRDLLLSEKQPLIETASTSKGENIRLLSPVLPEQLKHKIDIMNAHWQDYNKLLTMPNP